MRLRKNILPRTLPDISATVFLATAIPIVYWFELWVVFPEFHATNSTAYMLLFGLGSFALFNIVANMLGVMIVDTSIKGRVLTPPTNSLEKLWRMCAVCETLAPPRSWHCPSCKTCILKRDHHCLFTGHCVGHQNQRYFMMLLFYMFISTTVANVYNNWFVWVNHCDEFCTRTSIIKIVFPLAMLVWDTSYGQYYLLVYLTTMIGTLFTGTLLVYHISNMVKGSVVHERKIANFDLGWKRNMEIVFGERWHLVWISPFLESNLPHDGIHWETILEGSIKNR